MDPNKPSQLIPFLQEKGLLPKKSLSQNFLIDQNVVAKILQEAAVKEGETILEIGSGPGCLTKALLEQGCTVIAVEKDVRFATLLRELFPSDKLTVINQDFLTYTIDRPLKVVANIPYHITASILERLAFFSHLCSKITLLAQKDMVDRISVIPPSRNANFLSYYLHFLFTFSKGFTVSSGCFWPKPHIASHLFSLIPKKLDPEINKEEFSAFLSLLFKRKRKMIRASLNVEKIEDILASLGLSPTARPEELSIEEFLQFYKAISLQSSGIKTSLPREEKS